MWLRFTLRDVRIIGHYLGVLVMLSSVMYAIPFILALCLQEWEPAVRYLTAAGFSLVLGALMRLLYIGPRRLDRQQAIAVTGLIYIILSFVATFP